MSYEINISKNGQHYFATAERSISSNKQLKEIYSVLKKTFPKSKGFELSVTNWEKIGKSVDISKLK